MQFQLRVGNWRSYIPLLEVLATYRREYFQNDLVAGLIVGVITVPQAMAYAFLAGLPAEAGLYACLLPMLIYTVFGSSRHLVVGPVAVAALMVAATIGEHTAKYDYDPTSIAVILSLQVGILLWLLRLWQMGGLVNLLSHPVISGFVNAAAALIVFSQIPAFTGMPMKPGNPLDQAAWYLTHLQDIELLPIVIGALAIALIWFFQRHVATLLRRQGLPIPDSHAVTRMGPIAVMFISALLVWLLDLGTLFGLETVGHVPGGLPEFSAPPFDFWLWFDLLDSAARQVLLYRALGLGPIPTYCHLPLVRGADGKRLAKRHGDTRLDSYRSRGVRPERLIGLLARWSGSPELRTSRIEMSASEFLRVFRLDTMAREDVVFTPEDEEWLCRS